MCRLSIQVKHRVHLKLETNFSTKVKIGEVGGRLPSYGSLLLRIWLLPSFGKMLQPSWLHTDLVSNELCYIVCISQYEWDAGYFRDCNGVSNGIDLPDR